MEKIKAFISQKRWLAIVLATLLLSVVYTFTAPAFLDSGNFQGVLMQASVTGIMAVGLTFVILTGGIDISIGAILFLSAAIFATVYRDTESYFAAFSIAVGAACFAGILNGYLVYKFKMAPMITTLATYNIFRGIALHVTKALNIPIPREISFLGNGRFYGIPIPLIIMLVAFVIGIYLFSKTRFGTFTKAIGNSEQSAKESNLPVRGTIIVAYFIAGLTAGLSGVVLLSRTGGLQGGMGIGLEFTVIAAVVLGGTKLSGGSGSVIGSVIGAIFLVLIDNGLNLMNASPYIYDSVRGIVLLIAVIVDRISVVRQSIALQKQKEARVLSAAKLGLDK